MNQFYWWKNDALSKKKNLVILMPFCPVGIFQNNFPAKTRINAISATQCDHHARPRICDGIFNIMCVFEILKMNDRWRDK